MMCTPRAGAPIYPVGGEATVERGSRALSRHDERLVSAYLVIKDVAFAVF